MRKLLFLFITAVVISSCKNDTIPTPDATDDFPLADSLWSVNVSDIQEGKVGKDGIKAIDEPVHVSTVSATFLKDDDLVIGISYKGKAIAYPVKMLDYHELINDQINDLAFTVSYSVLTATAVVFVRKNASEETRLRVSGLLYKSNLIMYDEETRSLWSQMLLKSIGGSQMNSSAAFYPSFQTTWKTWKSWYPETQVMGKSAEIEPDYTRYPYGNYRENNDSLFFGLISPLQVIPDKERLLGIKTEKSGVYIRPGLFGQLNSYVTRKIGDEEVLVFGSEKDNYLMAYCTKTVEGSQVTIRESLLGREPGGLFIDTRGTKWDLNGIAYEGPGKGDKLEIPVNFVGYAFAWALFYPEFFRNEQ